MPEPLPWGDYDEQTLNQRKLAFKQPLTLGLSSYKKPFTLFMGTINQALVLTQEYEENGGSVQLDPVAKAYPDCLKAVPEAVRLVEVSPEPVSGN